MRPRYAQLAPDSATVSDGVSGPLLVYRASLQLAVHRVGERQGAVEALAHELGGYLASRTEETIEVRVPARAFDEAMRRIQELGDVIARSVEALDVTEEFHDVELRIRQQIGPPEQRQFDGLTLPPLAYLAVVPRHEHVGHLPFSELRRPSVMRIVQQAARKRIARHRVFVADDARNESRDGVDNHKRRQLAAADHVVADRQLLGRQIHPHPIVDPWVHVLPRRVDVDAEIFVLLTEPSRERIDSLLEGWPDLQSQSGGFEELMSRLDKAGYPPPW